jgi:hypothetical protein
MRALDAERAIRVIVVVIAGLVLVVVLGKLLAAHNETPRPVLTVSTQPVSPEKPSAPDMELVNFDAQVRARLLEMERTISNTNAGLDRFDAALDSGADCSTLYQLAIQITPQLTRMEAEMSEIDSWIAAHKKDPRLPRLAQIDPALEATLLNAAAQEEAVHDRINSTLPRLTAASAACQ